MTEYERPLTTSQVKQRLEDLFGGIKISEVEPNVVRIQRFARSYIVRKRLRTLATLYRESEITKRPRLRQRKTKEILDTELSYLESLRSLVRRYYEPMKEITIKRSRFFSSPILSEKAHSTIFMNIILIHEFHETFYSELKSEYEKWPAAPVRLGKKFLQLSPFLKLYTEYTNCYQKSSSTLQECLGEQSFGNWMDAHKQENMDCVPLESLLIMPIQRIPRYRMLLEEVVKYTPEEHIDYSDLCQALEQIKEIATYINERKRQAENTTSLEQIQSTLRGLDMNIAHRNRRLLKCGELIRMNPETNSQEKRYFFLLNDMMLASTIEENNHMYDGYILIRDAKMLPMKQKLDFGVQYSTGKKVYYRAESEEAKRKWMNCFQKGISELEAFPPDQASDFLMEKEHFGGGTSTKAGSMKTYETRLLIRKLKSRWFIIRNGILYKQKSPQDKNVTEALQLENYKIRHQSLENKDPLAFDLVHPVNTRTFVLQTRSEKYAWIEAMEDCINAARLPITDLCVIHVDKGEKVPLGYIPLHETYYGHYGNVNSGGGGREILICYERGGKDKENKPKRPITNLGVIFTDRGSRLKRKVPEELSPKDGWTQITKTYYQQDSADLNCGKGGRDIFLLYKRESNRPAITRLTLYWKIAEECVPPGFSLLEHTVSGAHFADLNTGAGNPEIFLCYKKESDVEKFFQTELEWDARVGFTKSKLSIAWQHLLSEVGVSDAEIEGDNDKIRFTVEETLKKYQELRHEKPQQTTCVCYSCTRPFEYPPETNKVYCPFCQTLNQCPYVRASGNTTNPRTRLLGESCGPRIENNQTTRPPGNDYFRSNSVAAMPSNPQSNLPSYITGIYPPAQPTQPTQPAYSPAPYTSAYPPAPQASAVGIASYLQNIVPPGASYVPQAQPIPSQYYPGTHQAVPSYPQQTFAQVPLGSVPKQQEEYLPGDNSVDFSALSDAQYKSLVEHVRKRLVLKSDGLEDFQFVNE